ncbi:MAG: hypothetical protein ACD_50C00069G0002 [uncultured bacterium]|nr:MAG: hypothetical protein ACD_50C00069G0002 [uncultured bacterium]
MTKFKAVLDTNIYLSGIIFGGNAKHILDLVIEDKITVFISPAIFLEIAEKLEQKFNWDKNRIITVVKTISKTATAVNPKQKINAVKADRNDNKIIEAAVESNADFIITGDKHLLNLKKYREIKIVSPSQFLTKYFHQS